MHVTCSYATSDWNRGSVSSSTLTEICADYDPLARRKERGAGIRKRIGYQPRLDIVASCRDPYTVLRMLHPTVSFNGRRFLSEEIRPTPRNFSQYPVDFFPLTLESEEITLIDSKWLLFVINVAVSFITLASGKFLQNRLFFTFFIHSWLHLTLITLYYVKLRKN